MREICYCPTKLCTWRPNNVYEKKGCVLDIVLPEDLSYYFTIACWIEEVKASSSRTCVEGGGAVCSALGSGVRGMDLDWIAKAFAGWIVIGL